MPPDGGDATPPETPPRLVIVRDGRHPLVTLTMIACLLAGAIGLLLPPSPQSVIDRFIPEPARSAYYALLLLAGLVTLVGVWLPDLRDRLLWERIGLLFFSGTLLLYALAIFAVAPGKLGAGALFSCLFGFGGCWRVVVITLTLRSWVQATPRRKRRQR